MGEDYIDDHNLERFIDKFTHMIIPLSSAFKSRAQPKNCLKHLNCTWHGNMISKISDAGTQHLVAADCKPIKDNA